MQTVAPTKLNTLAMNEASHKIEAADVNTYDFYFCTSIDWPAKNLAAVQYLSAPC